MEDLASLWSYQESFDELKQRLLYTTLELESVRMEANEEMRKNKENVKELLQILKIALQERDEAKDQLQKLLNIPPTEFFTNLPNIKQSESPILKHTKANSTITESSSFSDPYNYKSHGSSPVNSFFDPVSSPDLPNMNSGALVQDFSSTISTPMVVPLEMPKIDQVSMVIDDFAKGKTLPQKGKFLQAVLEAGPLLQTLLLAGPLPRWRNPPPHQHFQVPPVLINGCDVNARSVVPNPMSSSSYVEMSCGSSQMMSSSMLNFGSSYVPTGKRQRLQ